MSAGRMSGADSVSKTQASRLDGGYTRFEPRKRGVGCGWGSFSWIFKLFGSTYTKHNYGTITTSRRWARRSYSSWYGLTGKQDGRSDRRGRPLRRCLASFQISFRISIDIFCCTIITLLSSPSEIVIYGLDLAEQSGSGPCSHVALRQEYSDYTLSFVHVLPIPHTRTVFSLHISCYRSDPVAVSARLRAMFALEADADGPIDLIVKHVVGHLPAVCVEFSRPSMKIRMPMPRW